MPRDSLRKLIPIRITFKRSGMASQPTLNALNNEWIWSALDVARRAAIADDPSIKRIADTFTQMLRQLQELKRKNRDDFREIASEIASLINLLVTHTGEHDSTPQRFVKIRDDFLSAVLIIQSELGKMFCYSGSAAYSSTKSKSYQDILRTYEFQIRLLRSDLQAVIATKASSPSGFFNGANGFIMVGGTFTEIHGNNTTISTSGTPDIQALSTQSDSGLDLSDFKQFKIGDLQAVTVERMRIRRSNQDCVNDNDDAVAREYTIRIEDQIKTARTYSGKDPLQAFLEDVEIILEQRFRHPHVVQLFGVCRSNRMPTLVFHGDLREMSDDAWRVLRVSGLDELRKAILRRLRIYREWQDACLHLMRVPQFSTVFRQLSCGHIGPCEGKFSLRVYMDEHEHLQLSIQSPTTSLPSLETSFCINFLLHEIRAIEEALSHGVMSERSPIDKKKCLLELYNTLIGDFFHAAVADKGAEQHRFFISSARYGGGGVQPTPDHDFLLKWEEWWPKLGIEVVVGGISCTRFACSKTYSKPLPQTGCFSYLNARREHLKSFFAQATQIMPRIQSLYDICNQMQLVIGAQITMYFQSDFTSSLRFPFLDTVFLFVLDPQYLDDAFDMTYFWAKDPDGLEPLNEADMLVLGLGVPHLSIVRTHSWDGTLALWDALRVFHDIFGFTADSPDVVHFLGLSPISLECPSNDNEDEPATSLVIRPWKAKDPTSAKFTLFSPVSQIVQRGC